MAAWAEQRSERQPIQLRCARCGCLSGLKAAGWRGYRADEPALRKTPVIEYFCPTCAAERSALRNAKRTG